MKSIFEQNGGTYTQVSDYLIPNISLPDAPAYPIGKYGRMREAYLYLSITDLISGYQGFLRESLVFFTSVYIMHRALDVAFSMFLIFSGDTALGCLIAY